MTEPGARPQHVSSVGDVSLIGRLAWLAAALWVIAVKSVVVVEFTPVALTSERAFATVYGMAFGMPAALLLGWIIRSGLRFAWKPGLVAALLLSGYLVAVSTSGLLAHLMFTSPPWQTDTVLYVHRTDANRTIERQVKYTIGRRFRFVQQRTLTSFLAYVEPVEFSSIQQQASMQPEWKPAPGSGRLLR